MEKGKCDFTILELSEFEFMFNLECKIVKYDHVKLWNKTRYMSSKKTSPFRSSEL